MNRQSCLSMALPVGALLNKREVADLLHVSPRTLDRLRSQGLIEALKVRSRVLFRPEAVAAFVAKSSETPSPVERRLIHAVARIPLAY